MSVGRVHGTSASRYSDFEAYWKFHLKREHTRNHAAHYAKTSAALAALAKPNAGNSRAHLTVIK